MNSRRPQPFGKCRKPMAGNRPGKKEFLHQAGSVTKKGSAVRIKLFDYQADPDSRPNSDWVGWGEEESTVGESEDLPRQTAPSVADAGASAELERRIAAETKQSFESGREQGRKEGRQAERDAQAATMVAAEDRQKRQMADLLVKFTQERDHYLERVEHEVVALSLAVAARILRRESQMDPLLLTGAVRVALGQLSGSTEVRLRVPPAELELWVEAMALLPNLAVKPSVVAGQGMLLGDCAIETGLGSVDLGIRAQLGEIERGFFDRAGRTNSKPPGLKEEALHSGAVTGS